MSWKKKPFNIQNIKHQTEKSILIAMPHKSDYDGFVFWHPTKLVRNGSHSYEATFSFTDDFVFHLKKYGKGRYNGSDVIAEKELSAIEMESIHFV